ncbi:thioredoxin family protein [Xiashengella succiniciproducens]|jgi:small redox-active disulfide protein 2|uniref:Thioredoxin family protein n=1 Tax=Xiashengella succiniciproducens TaxID=2949635 RepID=A0A9J6ZT08_9BACT|nr:thioredoxin family protein [Alkaliflexus sp. Ai-910]URW80721.1 thioredoxin family protein [Alkaliflexus sp. Ai-910]
MEIKILGTGCAKCKTAQAVVEKVVAESGIEATITKVEDIMDIMKYNIMSTPAVVVDEVVKIKGRVPSEAEVRQALGL